MFNSFDFKDKTVCITGGNGFIGKELIKELESYGCNIKILTRKENTYFPKNINKFVGNLTNTSASLTNFIKDCDILFHCAGETINISEMRLLHVNGTQKLIDLVYEESARSKKTIHWIQLSSCGAYGPPPKNNIQIKRTINELSETNPINEYEITKTESDNLVIASSNDQVMSFTILRPSNVIGKNMKNQSMHNLLKFIKSGYFFFIGKKDSIATYVHVDDVVNALIKIASNPKSRNEIFNLSCDCSWVSLVTQISFALNVKILPFRIPYILLQVPLIVIKFILGKFIHIPLFSAFALRTSYTTKKIEKCLNFKFIKPMPDTINTIIESKISNN
jgi:nucleoside-diphosphate-sugar epimerase